MENIPSACALRLFIEALKKNEEKNQKKPRILQIIKSFIFVYTNTYNNYSYISNCYFNKYLTGDENSIINWLFYIYKRSSIEEQIAILHRYINGNLKQQFLKGCVAVIKEDSKETQYKLLTYEELNKLRNLIGIYHFMNTNKTIKDIDFMYIYNITLLTRHINLTLNNSDYLQENRIFEYSTEYPSYTKNLIVSLTKTRNKIDELIGKIKNTEEQYFQKYIKEIIKEMNTKIDTMLI